MKTSYAAPIRRALAPALTAAALAGGLAACGDSITNLKETSPTFLSPETFYRNDADAAAAVNGVYQPLLDWNLWRQPAQDALMCDDNEMLCQNWQGGGFSGNQAGQWYVSRPYTGDYQIIQRANDVVANVGKSAGISAPTKRLTIGQALFARGYAYFDLVRRFGGVPLRLEPYTPESTLGDKPRAPVPDVYAQIVKDLRAAADSLPAAYGTANGQGLPRAATAWGMLAKVYLHMAGDEVAGTALAAAKATYADSASMAAAKEMADASVRLEANYLDVFDASKQNTSPEILFAVQASAAASQGSDIVSYFAPSGDCTLAGGCGQGFVSMREDFYRTFDPADKRVEPNRAVAHAWEVTYSPYGKVRALHVDSLATLQAAGLVVKDSVVKYGGWTEGCGAFGSNFDQITLRDPATPATTTTAIYGVARPVFTLKYVDPSARTSATNTNNFIILRHADVLLVYAEALNEARGGPTAEAYAAVNQVRARAGLPALSGLDQTQFRQAVWAEREHELYGEFQARFDLIREGRWLDVMNAPSAVADFASHGVCRPRQAYQKLFPLPQSELAGNSVVQQNPGY